MEGSNPRDSISNSPFIIWDTEVPGWLLYDGRSTTTFREDAAKFTDVERYRDNPRYQIYPARALITDDENTTRQGESNA